MITIVDSIMGSGKTSWVIQELLDKQTDKNYLYIAPKLKDIDSVISRSSRKLYAPQNRGNGKLGNIVDMLNNGLDIASTHELFRRFDERCKEALRRNRYTLIMDEALSAVEQFQFEKPDDYKYLIKNDDIVERDDGMIEWTGNNEMQTRFDDVRILSQNHCLFRVDKNFYLWHFPHDIFTLFDDVYVLTYFFPGSLLKYYFDIYGLEYKYKSIAHSDEGYHLVSYYKPDLTKYIRRFDIYDTGSLLQNISQKPNAFGSIWCKSSYHKKELTQTKKNMANYSSKIIKAKSNDIMWTCFKSVKGLLSNKGYARGFVECNCRGTNDYDHKTCLMYCVNWYVNPEIMKFFQKRGITIDQDAVALSEMIQWIWRSNIRRNDSTEIIHLYIPSPRMRRLFKDWLYQTDDMYITDVPAALDCA